MISDEQLARRIQQGNEADLRWLVECHHALLLGFLWRITNGVVSTLQLQEGVQFRVLGDPDPKYNGRPAEPSLEDGYMWLMSQNPSAN